MNPEDTYTAYIDAYAIACESGLRPCCECWRWDALTKMQPVEIGVYSDGSIQYEYLCQDCVEKRL